jgi:dUTP pyrophosphatase
MINKGIKKLNSPETIESDYRGEDCVIHVNMSDERFVIKDSERICKMLITRHGRSEWESVGELKEN